MPEDARVWLIAPGENARLWNEFQKEGIIAIGWDDLGDLTSYEDRKGIHERCQEIYGPKPNPTGASLACYRFAYEVNPGDLVIAKQGRHTLLGHGVVTSDYEFDDRRSEYKHVRKVDWRVTGRYPRPEDKWLPANTLTDKSRKTSWNRSAFQLMGGEPPNTPSTEPGTYTQEEGLEGLSEEDFDHIISALKHIKTWYLKDHPG